MILVDFAHTWAENWWALCLSETLCVDQSPNLCSDCPKIGTVCIHAFYMYTEYCHVLHESNSVGVSTFPKACDSPQSVMGQYITACTTKEIIAWWECVKQHLLCVDVVKIVLNVCWNRLEFLSLLMSNCRRIGRAEENDNKWWYVLMLVFSGVFYIGSLVAIILLYVFFTTVSCLWINQIHVLVCT